MKTTIKFLSVLAILTTMLVVGLPEEENSATLELKDCRRVLWRSNNSVVYVSKSTTKIRAFKGKNVICKFEKN